MTFGSETQSNKSEQDITLVSESSPALKNQKEVYDLGEGCFSTPGNQTSVDYCIECKEKMPDLFCQQCEDDFCQGCFTVIHSNGKRRMHTVKVLSLFSSSNTGTVDSSLTFSPEALLAPTKNIIPELPTDTEAGLDSSSLSDLSLKMNFPFRNKSFVNYSRSKSVLFSASPLGRTKSLGLKRRLTISNMPESDRYRLLDKLQKENDKYVSSDIDSTGFLLAQLEKVDIASNNISPKDECAAIKSPHLFKTEFGPEELSANYVPTSFPRENQGSLPFSSESNSVEDGGIDDSNDFGAVYESLPDWEFWCTTVEDYAGVARKTPHLLSAKIRLGIPSILRGTLWQTMSQSSSTYLETLYHQLLKEKDFACEKIIQRDIPRTFPRLPMFSEESGVGQTRLFNVMKAYSLYDTEVGYCQGLGFMVGPLLMNLPELEAFCVFVRLMETYDMRTMFTVKMEGLRLRLYQLGALITELLPDLANHLASHNISTALYASQWFLSLFAYSFPLTLVQRIFDVVFAEGAPETIMRVAIALLQKNQQTLIAMEEFDELIGFLTSAQLFEAYSNSATKLISDAIAVSSEVSKQKLDELSESYAKETDSAVFCQQRPSVPRKASGWIQNILTSLYPDPPSLTTRSSSSKKAPLRIDIVESPGVHAPSTFFMNPENCLTPKPIRRNDSSDPLHLDSEIDVLRHAVHDLQTTTESHLTALTQLRQDHIQLKNDMVHLKSDKFTLQEENELLRHELAKCQKDGLDFQQQSRDALLRQQEYIQVVEKQLLDANLYLKQLQDERDRLLVSLESNKATSEAGLSTNTHKNFAIAFRRFLTKG